MMYKEIKFEIFLFYYNNVNDVKTIYLLKKYKQVKTFFSFFL